MKMIFLVSFGLFICSAGIGQTVAWASAGDAPTLGAPDAVTSSLASTSSAFSNSFSYSGLAALLGINQSLIGSGQVLAFENNGGSGPLGGWESSRWNFAQGANSLTVDYDETQLNGATSVTVASGNLSANAYQIFFGLPTDGNVYSFALFQLPWTVDPNTLSVSITNGNSLSLPGEGSPDRDAVGVITAVPEPVSFLVLASGCMGLLSKKRRKH